RQYPQNFDGLTLSTTALDNVELFYGLLLYVNTVNANARALDALPQSGATVTTTDPYFTSGRRKLVTNLFNLNWQGYEYGSLALYAYLNKDKTIITNSHTLYGARLYSTEDKNYM